MRIYIPNTSRQSVGGGWTFMRNLQKSLGDRVHFVNTWQECDVVFVMGITMFDKDTMQELITARYNGKKFLFRVDNVPKKSRNRSCTPHERMKHVSDLCDVVIYQSQWAKNYCEPLCGDGAIIYNGVDTNVFKNPDSKPDNDIYLFAFHGKSEMKGFWTAHAYFQNIYRKNKNASFWFINDFGSETGRLVDSNFDFWNGEEYVFLPPVTTKEEVAKIMKQCTHLIFPSVFDASPNTVLEAMACGLKVVGYPDPTMSGTSEIVDNGIVSLEEMGDEYYGVLKLLIEDQSNG